ncbi:MAG: diaminopimelate decarboxylase [Alphaproteobacteria bacterium]|nr:diaminopimelate decarboxylase [Alphaproteobacteria bacterium]|tara:strand:- start:3434 stop:4729 length:1296 start_codon:yes stop_codon:yes gene_type:complete
MDHFVYRNGELYAEDVPLSRIAAEIGTPLFCYSTATLQHHYRVFTEAFSGVDAAFCYAVKANANLAVIRTLAEMGAGADVVSAGELERALAAGVAPAQIVFSGVGKSREELSLALDKNIGQFNVESSAELDLLSDIAASKGLTAQIAVRVNPDVDADTHEKISTGRHQDKFGIPWPAAREDYARAKVLPGIEVVGVAAHIGSQITSLAPFEAAFTKIVGIVDQLRHDGHDIRRLDLGGGLGIPYEGETPPTPSEYAEMVKRVTAAVDCELVFEPGRVIVGNAGVLVSRVLYIKESAGHTFTVLDAAMNDLLRPSLYDAHHAIVPVRESAADTDFHPTDIVGPICESGDVFAHGRPMPPLATDDLLVIRTAGAYGAVMSSNYNSRPLAAEVLVNGDIFEIVRRHQTNEEMLALEEMPSWFDDHNVSRTRGVA